MKSSLVVDGRRRFGTLPIPNSRVAVRKASCKVQAGMLPEDEKLYGDRCPTGYRKKQLLGRGGCAVVWLGENYVTGQQVALKQVSRMSGLGAIESCKREVFFGNLLNSIQHPAMANVAKLVASKSDRSDLWAIFELGGANMGKALFQLKGEFIRSERVYNILHLPLYRRLHSTPEFLKAVMRELFGVLVLLSEVNMVHSDLKPDNILITDEPPYVRVIDFGSAFSFLGTGSIVTATPEYMPPEALALAHTPGDNISQLAAVSHPWSFDIWSLGMVFLEILTGIPLWMSLKSRVNKRGRVVPCKGLLGASGRDPKQILKLQLEATRDLVDTLRKHAAVEVHADLCDLLQRMLQWDPVQRVSPSAALAHPFLRS